MTTVVIGCAEESANRAAALLGTPAVHSDGQLRERTPAPVLEMGGLTVRYVPLKRGDMLQRAFSDPELDVAELSLSDYVRRVARDDCEFALLPVYIRRALPHRCIFVRADRAIHSPKDLIGRRVGTGAYQRTLNVWLRGFLQDYYGVLPDQIDWQMKDNAESLAALSVLTERTGRSFPVTVVEEEGSLVDMLRRGEIDAMIGSHPPPDLAEPASDGNGGIRYLFPSPDDAARQYFEAGGVIPILHVMGIRRAFALEHPALPARLWRNFAASDALTKRASSAASLQDHRTARPSTWQDAAFTYGFGDADLRALSAFLRYHFEQGLSDKALTVPMLFAPLDLFPSGTTYL